MRNKIRNILERIRNTRMSFRVSLLYVMGSGILLALALLVYGRMSQNEKISNNSRMARQATETVKNALESMVSTIHYNSRVILSSQDIQEMLKDTDISATEARDIINKNSAMWMTALPYIDSLYIFDFRGNHYGLDKKYFKSSTLDDISQATWYKDVMDSKGYYILSLNGDYFLKREEDGTTMSFLRVINDTHTFLPKGILMVNIDEAGFKDCYNEYADNTNMMIAIEDKDGNIISTNYESEEMTCQEYISQEKQDVVQEESIMEEYGWKIISVVQINNPESGMLFLRSYFVLCVVFIFIMFFFSFGLTFWGISRPIEKMAEIMNNKSGNLQKMNMQVPRGELTVLKDTYNEMVDRNGELIRQINEVQRFKRKAELRALHEQIKPHFLYNTINAMQYLAATHQDDALYDALEMFGAFYRKSLSKGKEVITVREEIGIVEDYVGLQKLRYGEDVQCIIHAKEEVYALHVLKLILQPLVENSICHGIMPKMKPGTITIDIFREKEYLVIRVKDDGIGMKQEELERVMDFAIEDNHNSFGLRGTVERIKNYYENDFVYQVKSVYGEGTEITLKFSAVLETGGINVQNIDSGR